MASTARAGVRRRLSALIGGAVLVTAFTVATALAAVATPTGPRSQVPGFLLDRGRHTAFEVPSATAGLHGSY